MRVLEYYDSNKKQDYATHPMFRYFGKLPPTLVSYLIDTYCKPNGNILELMCGSGTTLVESYIKKIHATGVDINPLSVLISKAKTTKIPEDILIKLLVSLENYSKSIPDEAYNYFRPVTRNLDYWFTQNSQNELSAIKYYIDNKIYIKNVLSVYEEECSYLLKVTFAGIIRKVSNASPRTGRIFRCKEDNKLKPINTMIDSLKKNIDLINRLDYTNIKYPVLNVDARNTGLERESFDFILNHPPYFALYKYSSDVLRFELEWLNFNRSNIAKNEIEDGFKTTNAQLLNDYILDMKDVFKEMYHLMKNNAISCVVVSDSTLREEQLPVVENLIEAAKMSGLNLKDHYLRPVSFAQASYHKSSNPNIKTNEDHILIFNK